MTDDEINAKFAAVNLELQSLKSAPSAAGDWKRWVKGSFKSLTNAFGAFLIAWPALQPQLEPLLTDIFGEYITSHGIQLVGVLVILLRIKTTESLKDKVPPATT